MTRFTKLGALALVAGVVVTGFVACNEEPEGQTLGPATVSPGSVAGSSERGIDTQASRIFSKQIAAEKVARETALRAKHSLQPETAGSPNFTITTTNPVQSAVAIVGDTGTSSDLLIFGPTSGGISGGISGCGTTCTGNNFFALQNIHSTAPTVKWAKTLTGNLNASTALNGTATEIYVFTNDGKLACFNTSTGATCTASDGGAWVTPTISITGNAITPWVDTGLNAIYINDGKGNLYRYNATSGAKVWGPYSYSSSGSLSWPLEADSVIYVGDGSGVLYRVVDTGVLPTSKNSVSLSGINTNCASGTNVSIDGSVSLDTSAALVFLPWQGCVYSFPHSAGTLGSWSSTTNNYTGSIPDKTFQTWPALDGTFAYWVIADLPTGFNNTSAIWKAPYALNTTDYPTFSALQNASSTVAGASVGAAPVFQGNNVFVGDQSGYVEEFGCASSVQPATQFLAETNQATGSVNTPIVVDDANGNIEYGFSNGVAQFPFTTSSSFNWNCPTGTVACSSQTCGTGPSLTQCVSTAVCNPGACTTATAAGVSIQLGSAAAEGDFVTGTQTGPDGGTTFSCPTNQVILGVLAASYGTPPIAAPDDPVTPPTFEFGACSGSNSLSTTLTQCPVNTTENCSFAADNTTFTDPCIGTVKNYEAWFACGTKTTDAGVPNLCSRQNVSPTTGSDPCAANPDGGLAVCQGSCFGTWRDCKNGLQYDGCETNIEGNDPSNCGGCGVTCIPPNNGTATCSSGSCGYTCNSGYNLCNGVCLATSDYQTDANNCGNCGNICVGGGTCTAGVCSAPAGSCSTVASVTGATIQVAATTTESGQVLGTNTSDAGTTEVCPSGTVIQQLLGASFGTPPSSDGTVDGGGGVFLFNGTGSSIACHNDDSFADTQTACPSLNSTENCTFTSGNGTFGDPCVGTVKNYYAWFVCAPKQGSGSLPFYCSRQNVTPTSGTDPCIVNPDGGASFCSGTCVSAAFKDCDKDLQSNGCEAELAIDPNNCGGCAGAGGTNCAALDAGTPYCVAGVCSATTP